METDQLLCGAEFEKDADSNEVEQTSSSMRNSLEVIDMNYESESVDMNNAIEIKNPLGVNEEIELSRDITDKDVHNPPFQLLKAERDLLMSCTQDATFRKRTGNLDWDKIENIFVERADGCKIFKRNRKRLRSSKNYNAREIVVTENLPCNSEEIIQNYKRKEALPLVDSRDEEEEVEADQVALDMPATGARADLKGEMREESVSEIDQTELVVNDKVTRTVHSGELKRMVGTLSDLERDFVKNYGKKCLTMGKNIDNNCMLKEYRTVFPDFSRDGDILKKCWNNWKKDSPAYKEFINKLNK